MNTVKHSFWFHSMVRFRFRLSFSYRNPVFHLFAVRRERASEAVYLTVKSFFVAAGRSGRSLTKDYIFNSACHTTSEVHWSYHANRPYMQAFCDVTMEAQFFFCRKLPQPAKETDSLVISFRYTGNGWILVPCDMGCDVWYIRVPNSHQ